MALFIRRLAAAQPADSSGRRWVYVPYDQLTDAFGPLSSEPERLGIVLVETRHKPGRRRYHKQKLLWILTNQRHFALEQAERGVAVDYRFDVRPYGEVLRDVVAVRGPLQMMEAAERELRHELAPLVDEGLLEVVPHEGWLTSVDDLEPERLPWRMDRFYRRVRQRTGWLMVDGKPEGGKYSHDTANREAWDGAVPLPVAPEPPVDEITEEAAAAVEEHFGDHPGRLDPRAVVATAEDAQRWWSWALTHALPHFGTYEDAMTTASRTLFHTRISPLLNLQRLSARRVVEDVACSDHPLNAREGFVRQVLGWREFVRHVHRLTDGFRALPDGYERDHLGADRPLPQTYWGSAPSGLSCLDTTVRDVWDTGYSHHIQRLMVLSNLALLMDVDAQELSDWFWVAYVDAFDWVVEPNVLGMGTFSLGPLMTTKPYVSGSKYLDKMSDYCAGCAFDPKKSCPITSMYWDFLRRHRDALGAVQRMRLPLASQRKRSADRQQHDQRVAARVMDLLARGDRVRAVDLTPLQLAVDHLDESAG